VIGICLIVGIIFLVLFLVKKRKSRENTENNNIEFQSTNNEKANAEYDGFNQNSNNYSRVESGNDKKNIYQSYPNNYDRVESDRVESGKF